MSHIAAVFLAILFSGAAQAAEYMEKTPFQLSRVFAGRDHVRRNDRLGCRTDRHAGQPRQ